MQERIRNQGYAKVIPEMLKWMRSHRQPTLDAQQIISHDAGLKTTGQSQIHP